MSKADAISAGITLIVTPIGYFIGGPKTAAICFVAGLCLLLSAHFFFRKQQEPTFEAPPLAKTGDVQVGDFRSGDVKTGDIHINFPPQPQQPPSSPKEQEKKSNVIFLGASIVNLRSDGYQGISFREVPEKTDLRGIVACFRNEGVYGQPIKQFHNVRAHLRFKGSDGREMGIGVSGACWISSKNDLRNLMTDESACVLLLVSPNSGKLFVPWKERYRIDINSEGLRERDDELHEFPSTVEVRLVDGNKEQLLAPVVIDMTLSSKVLFET